MPVLLNPNFTEDDHRYSDDAGNVFPSVTEIIAEYWPIDRRFYQQSGTQRGTDVHTLTSMLDANPGMGPLEAAAIAPALGPYLQAWDKFVRDVVDGPDGFIWNEQRFIDEEREYAGTVDRLIRAKNGELWVIDIKSGKPETWHELQQGAYSAAARRCGWEVANIGTVQLTQSGKYKLIKHRVEAAETAWDALVKWRRYRREMKR